MHSVTVGIEVLVRKKPLLYNHSPRMEVKMRRIEGALGGELEGALGGICVRLLHVGYVRI